MINQYGSVANSTFRQIDSGLAAATKDPLLSRLEKSIGNLDDARVTVCGLASDLCGAIPSAGEAISPSGPNPGFAETIEMAITLIDNAAGDIRGEAARIRERLLR